MSADRPGSSASQQGSPYPDIESLIRATFAEMTRLAFGSLGNQPDAEDAVQTACVNVLRNWAVVGSLEAAGQQRAYLRKAVLNEIFQVWRRRQSRREFPLVDADAEWVVEWENERRYAAKIDLRRVWRAIAGLPEGCREVVSLYAAGYEYSQIAAMLGISASTVRSHMNRGRQKLRAALPGGWQED